MLQFLQGFFIDPAVRKCLAKTAECIMEKRSMMFH